MTKQRIRNDLKTTHSSDGDDLSHETSRFRVLDMSRESFGRLPNASKSHRNISAVQADR